MQREDVNALEALLVEDVVLTSDGGGKASAAIVPVAGSKRVSRFFAGVARKGARDIRRIERPYINGMPGIVAFDDAGVNIALAFETDEAGIRAIYAVRNPDKLARLQTMLARGA